MFKYPEPIADLMTVEPLPPLDAGTPHESVRETLQQLAAEDLNAARVTDEAMARCCLAGLWLWHNFLDESHTVSQDLATAEGSYWHGLMHRREPDFSNAKYWFRRVGEHAVYRELPAVAAELAAESPPTGPLRDLCGGSSWDPFTFVDACEAALRRGTDHELCVRLADAECRSLFRYCYRRAFAVEG